MVVQLRLILSFLRLKKNNILLSSYRQSCALGSSGVNISPRVKGGLNFFTGLSGDFISLRASNMKRYVFGFDAMLIPLKGVSSSLPFFKELPLLLPSRAIAVSPLGAWGSKFNAPSWFRREFLKHKLFCNAPRRLPSRLFSLSLTGFWLGTYSILSLLVNLQAVQFPWFFLSTLNPGIFFYKNLNSLGIFPDNRVFPSYEETKFLSLFHFFLPLPAVSYQGDLSLFTPEDLTYQIPLKRSVYASFADFAPYARFYTFGFSHVNNPLSVSFFFNLIYLGLWFLMAVPKHKRYKKNTTQVSTNLFSITKRTLYPHVLIFTYLPKFRNQTFWPFAQDYAAVTETLSAQTNAFLHHKINVSLHVTNSIIDSDWSELFSVMNFWDFTAHKKLTSPLRSYGSSQSLFSYARYLGAWGFYGDFYRFFFSRINALLVSQAQQDNRLTGVNLSYFLRGFYNQSLDKLQVYPPYSYPFLVSLRYWALYLSFYSGAQVIFKGNLKIKSFWHFWRLSLSYFIANYHLFIARSFFALAIETTDEEFFLDPYTLSFSLGGDNLMQFLTVLCGKTYAVPPHLRNFQRQWSAKKPSFFFEGDGSRVFLPFHLFFLNPDIVNGRGEGFLIPRYL